MNAERVVELRPPLEAIVAEGRALTDQGNAERLVAQHGRDLRYVPGVGWHCWDGRRWRRDDDGEVMRRAKQTVLSIYADAARAASGGERKALGRHAARSDSEPRLRAAVSLAQSELNVIARTGDLDAHPLALNVENGTLDLATGELREHRRETLLTKLAPVTYRAGSTLDAWARFLADTTGGDPGLAGFLQRAAGYTLTGDTGAEVLFFAHGPGATGKSTLLESVKATLGEYAATADFEAFLARQVGGARTDIARLRGARMVVGVEVDDGQRLAEGLVKQLTGGDTITARHLYRDAFEYRPAFKLWLAANRRPRVRSDDDAIWRRILQVPFLSVVPPERRDPGLKRELTTNPDVRSAILAWAVEGCLAWQAGGLQVPDLVRDYTLDYRSEQDPLGDWLAVCCQLDADMSASAGELRSSYETWAQTNGERAIGTRRFGEALRAHGCRPRRARRQRTWDGIALAVTASDVTSTNSPT